MDWHIYQAWNVERYGDQFLLEAEKNGHKIVNGRDMFLYQVTILPSKIHS